ncbi:RNA 2',3'-cyclic phosphodiesterase [Halobacillus sp. A5]|uniref:RNA 2',3'-cyclic phosphodiesterase n=1 Tax=Halobacillus sp. A5 TaxID=2880263 RepID=UPI0020A6C5DA|nr:RNA 2',3'-cyclic phosphodiesterase [Halobacillus sp. A5]MCP3025331.1 RNA 2',3'-cyclic phosphodiesterase [Halobacillus sp. A5]
MSSHYFIGISVSELVKEVCLEKQRELRNSIDFKVWTHPEDLHITLKFLGACTTEQIHQWTARLKELPVPFRFPLKIGPAGYFGDQNHPRVLYVDVEKHSSLMTLKQKIEILGKEIGFPTEKRSYSPHITLAKKWKEGIQPKNWLTEELNMEINYFCLYKIHPANKPKYEKTALFKLKGD